MMMDEDALLQRAFALSMGDQTGDGGGDAAAATPAVGDDDEDPALMLAMQMSMHEEQAAAAGGGADVQDMLADASYVNSILSTLPGVDPNDPSIQEALNNAPDKDKEGEGKK
jgi:26S proteasome regulatory subunit N10